MTDIVLPASPKPALLVLASTYPRWLNDPEPGFVHELAKRLTGRFRVIVLCPHAAGAVRYESMDGVEVIRYRYAPERLQTLVNDGGIVLNLKRAKWKWLLVPGFTLMQVWQAWRLLRKERIDVIHAHWLIPQGLVAALLQLFPGTKVPFIATSHGGDVNAIRGAWMDFVKRWVVRFAVVVTTVSDALREALVKLGGRDIDARVRPMGVDLTERFVPADVPRDHREILFVGRLVPGKGVDQLIRAMPGILERIPEARLTIVGHGPEEASMKALSLRLGVSGCVSFAGSVAQKQLPGIYRRAGVFVASFGRIEGFGLVLVEAIGCGCPIVANDVPSARYILGEEFAELTVDCNDVGALVDRVVAVLGDPIAAQLVTDRLRWHVRERFDWRPVAEGYASIFEEVAGHEARG